MRRRGTEVAAVLLSLLLAAPPGPAQALGDRQAAAEGCAVAAGGDAIGNHLICNFGLTPEQVRELTEAAVRGATAPLASLVSDLSRQLGISGEATHTLLRIVGEQDVPLERLSETLSRVADSYRKLQAQAAALDPENPVARPLVEQAQAAIAGGELARARELLQSAASAQVAAARQARRLREKAEAAERAQLARAAATTATQGEVAMTELRYREAAALFAEAAELAPPDRAGEANGYLERQVEALLQEGTYRGDNRALADSIDTLHLLLRRRDREREPAKWANAQVGLGTALMVLGSRESGTARLEEAVAASRAALEALPRERSPHQWAETQIALGGALMVLGSRESGTARLEEAVAAWRTALDEATRERDPLQWAWTQIGVGNALMMLGLREGSPARLEEAVEVFRAALEAAPRERDPIRWALTQMAIGNALMVLGAHDGGTARLEEAVAAFRAALEEATRERVPIYWATTQMGLGFSLVRLGLQEGGTARLAEGVEALDGYLVVSASVGPDEAVQRARDFRALALREVEHRQGR